ncbi:MAG: phenylalanine--tRNA ligase subunit beta [Proteobacteria bacterium]|nr:phenylalanine--tRNA ligase subunit beta [Pseudomonadota bacterium]
MKISIEWLSDYIEVSDDIAKVAHTLTMAGLEVEGIDYRDLSFENVIVARISAIDAHPNADKLRICSVNAQDEQYSVVCGDLKVNIGDIVPLALPGAKLSGHKIKKSKLRGVESDGMLCSEKELGLTEESSGVMILPDDSLLGASLADVLTSSSSQIKIADSCTVKKAQGSGGYSDSIFEVGLTPNRPDCLSVFGTARELAALTGKKADFPEIILKESPRTSEADIAVEIKDPSLCGHYSARVIKGVKVERSPLWIRKRLEAAGVRAINNVVDVTNYVMLELGHPLHAFDLGRIEGGKIVVRKAGEMETLKTLDGVERKFTGEELLICDNRKPLAIAGIMGGDHSAVTTETSDIVLECAYFTPETVRITSRKLGLHTESSHRFERGVDPLGVERAINRAAQLLASLAGGEISSGTVEVIPASYQKREILFRSHRCNDILGINIDENEATGYLKDLGMELVKSGHGYEVSPPSYRVDIEREIDLIEEIARLKGYSSIPVEKLSGSMPSVHAHEMALDLMQVKRFMANAGYDEVVNYSFTSPDELDRLAVPSQDILRNTIKILNPISEELSTMRSTVIPGLLNAAAINIKKQNKELMLFETGKVFLSGNSHYSEGLRLCALMTGEKAPLLWKKGTDIFNLKGSLENLLDLLNLRDYTFTNCSDISYLHPGKGAKVFSGDIELAVIGELHPSVVENYDLGQKLFIFDLDLGAVNKVRGEGKSFKDIPVYPFVERDVALLVDKNVDLSKIMESFRQKERKLLESVEIFDQFEGESIGEAKKSIAFRLRYRCFERTLTDEEVNKLHDSIVKGVVEESGATVR